MTNFETTTPITFIDTYTFTACEFPTTDIDTYTVYDMTTSWIGDPCTLLLSGETGTTVRTCSFPTFYANELIPGETLTLVLIVLKRLKLMVETDMDPLFLGKTSTNL